MLGYDKAFQTIIQFLIFAFVLCFYYYYYTTTSNSKKSFILSSHFQQIIFTFTVIIRSKKTGVAAQY
jgi:hypothetical protein